MTRRALTNTLAILALAALSIPLAAADEGCLEHPVLVDHYLLKDAEGQLGISYKAPSAANATTWTAHVKSGDSKTFDLEFPTPAFEVDEAIDLAGRLKIGVRPQYQEGQFYNPFAYDHVSVRVELVEGERSVNLGYAYYSSEIELKGSYPGHGKDGAPHTHGAGNDAARGLYTSDLLVRITFIVEKSWFPVTLPSQFGEWIFEVHIDGKSFLRLAKAGEAPTEPAPEAEPVEVEEPAPEADEAEDEASPPPGDSDPETSESEDQKTQSLWNAPVTGTGALALAGLAAGLGIAILGWRRGRSR